MIVALIVLALAFLPMAFEARLAARHDRALRAAGASEPKDDVFPIMQVVYPTAFLAMALEAFFRDARVDAVFAAGAVVFAAAKTIKYWAIANLADRWTFKVLVLPGVPLVRTGPYRYVDHPNYIAVAGELVGMALMMSAWITGPLMTLAFGIALLMRLKVETLALRDERKR